MKEMKEKLLPIGSIVLLKGATKKVMITSYLIFSKGENDEKKMFDYGGCPYPEGIIESNFAVGFDHEKIEKVFHIGYEDEEAKALNKLLKESEKQLKDKFENEN